MNEQEREGLLEALIDRLRVEGVPEGTWLVDLMQAREQLRMLDGLLRRLTDAIVAGATPL